MGYQVLARKYRPQRFADVAGQEHVTRTLLNALSQNRVAHGYIFSGHRGIGKTTIARIVAMAVNCRTEVGAPSRPTHEPCGTCDSCTEIRQGNAVDVIEIDAATNRGIDEIRELRDAARYAPSRDRYKIYILDEAHQITDAAFNALLKTLEEPPAHVIFMMATTQPEDIPQTIRSRCQHFSFHAVKFDDILAQLKMIAAEEKVEAEEAALALLAEAGDGSMRDALSIMDQAIASAPVEKGRPVLSAAQIRELMGAVPNTVFERLMEAVAAGQSAELMEQLNLLVNAGHNPSSLARQMVRYLRNCLMAKLGGEQTELLQISADERARAVRTAQLFSEEELTRNLQIVLRTFDDLNYRQEQRFHLELGLIKLIHAQRLLPMEELLSSVGTARSATPSSTPASSPRPAASPARPAASAAPVATPTLSPFGSTGGSWGSEPKLESGPKSRSASPPTAIMERTAPDISFQSTAPFPAATAPAVGYASPVTEGALAVAPQAAAPVTSLPTIEQIRHAVGRALVDGGHVSAAQLLGTGAWMLDDSSLRIDVAGMGKKMLALTINTAAEKIIRQELHRLGAPTRFSVVPGEGTAQCAVPMAAPPVGSIGETALANPLVQRAREIFKADVRSVVDLRQK
ncbi:MAG TPA: DNA polymerase III subunit gamma/tau [Terracidiphilus sp.]|nr:DNA polymerase III subunit gamma/tau [Terracidiphilus sp.]